MDEKSQKVVEQASLVSQKIREALQASLPVAPEQLMTVQIPGTIIDTSETGPYVWNEREESDTPHRVKVNESRLVDNMVPLSKVMMGVTGKSVARSYSGALDMLIPEDAPIDMNTSTESKTIAAERYIGAMTYLTSRDPSSSCSVIDIYVKKQQAYSEAVNEWEVAKAKIRAEAKERFPGNVREQQRVYDDWNQESFRNFKEHAQAKYMDWIVNGNKYKVDYYFGIVDVSSAMKRVESSKEASRNLVVIDPDGSTEWQEVRLTPANWATICREKVVQWQKQNDRLSQKDFQSEIKRLNRLLLSYTGMMQSVDPDGKIQAAIGNSRTPKASDAGPNGVVQNGDAEKSPPSGDGGESTSDIDRALTVAYKDLYDAQNDSGSDAGSVSQKQAALQAKLVEAGQANMNNNKLIAKQLADGSKTEKVTWLKSMIEDTKQQITELKKGLANLYKTGVGAQQAITEVQKQTVAEPGAPTEGSMITTRYADDGDQYAKPKFGIPRNGVAVAQPANIEPSKWTKISLNVTASSQDSSRETSASSTSASVSGSWGLWSVAASYNHSDAAMKASEATANCSVEINFEALLVTIDRAWLHGELFSDPELNTSPDVALSPGALSLHQYIDQKNTQALSQYPYFPSYPTAFIVAANIELDFRGDTTNLEEAVESSHTDAQVKVGYGPFSLSASHSQDQSSAKTKMETTAAGTRITLEAPAIIGWVSQLVPELPRPKGHNFLMGSMI